MASVETLPCVCNLAEQILGDGERHLIPAAGRQHRQGRPLLHLLSQAALHLGDHAGAVRRYLRAAGGAQAHQGAGDGFKQ